MFKNLHPKCANPSCYAAFEWTAGGKLFRFRRNPASVTEAVSEQDESETRGHRVEHFWLCERCSKIYTLGYEPDQGVMIRLLWPELPAADEHMRLPVT